MGRGVIVPHSTKLLISFQYCARCAAEHTGETPPIASVIVAESEVEAKVWIEGKEYRVVKTIKELSV
jgi:hypothetical protein